MVVVLVSFRLSSSSARVDSCGGVQARQSAGSKSEMKARRRFIARGWLRDIRAEVEQLNGVVGVVLRME